ncbi:MAG: hypothetical protein QM490_02865 [Candidatus Gracilibacteria bacterium]
MKQVFSRKYHNKFIKYFKIKNAPSKVEENYYKKTIKYIKFIKWIPGLKMVGIGNSVSMNSAKNSSDIDLFIVTSNNSMWLVRILITLIFQIMGIRKTNKKHSGRFCLSFFSTIDGLDFNNFKIENDIYLYFWIIYFKPILDYNNTYQLFLNKNASWVDFSKYSDILEDNKKYIKYTGKSKLKNNKIIYILNNLFKKIFLPKTLKHYKSLGKPIGIVINNNMLKFHNNDIREKIKKDLV